MNIETATRLLPSFRSFTFLGIIFFIIHVSPLSAQDFDEALNLYQQQEYEQAAEMFKNIEGAEATLFTGKSFFGLGEYLKAQTYLKKAADSDNQDIYFDAVYTLALTDFQLKQFDEALLKLSRIIDSEESSQITSEAEDFYDDILNYLTLEQRKQVFQSVSDTLIRYDIVEAAMGNVDFPTAKLLIRQLENSLDNPETDFLSDLQEIVSDSLLYASKRSFANRLRAPDNITYTIGAAIPEYSTEDVEFGISQGLYFGYLMAANEFNQNYSNKTVSIKFKNTDDSSQSISSIMTDFVWNFQADAIIGPLYSEPAEIMAPMAESYQIPMLTPLANSDSLNLDNPYVFQANPTFGSHGKRMARYAVNNLGLDTLAVITESNSLGARSAYAFRDEAEKQGAKVVHFFVEDFESEGYEIGEYTKFFTADTARFESDRFYQLDGVYAPFTGQAAATLIDLLLIDLVGMESEITVLGSQEWGATTIRDEQLEGRDVFFSESYFQDIKSKQLEDFVARFKDEYGIEPNRFAMIGYDTATFLLQTLSRVENPALLKTALKEQPIYEGLITNINFDGTHINQEVKIFKYTPDGIIPAQDQE